MTGRYTRELETAVAAVRSAAAMYMGNEPVFRNKESPLGVYDVVSQNDIDAEEHIKKEISRAFPKDSFVCEESGESDRKSDRSWIIDPIDGTINYVHGLKIFGTQVCLTVCGEPVVSVMYIPPADEMFTAVKGEGAHLNGRRLDMRHTVRMEDSLLSIGDYSKGSLEFRENQVRLMDVLHDRIGRIKMLGSSCYDFTQFAAGRLDYHVRFVRNPWDFCPGLLMVEEAGGVYDRKLFEEHRLYVAACSKENLDGLCAIIEEEMDWYRGI